MSAHRSKNTRRPPLGTPESASSTRRTRQRVSESLPPSTPPSSRHGIPGVTSIAVNSLSFVLTKSRPWRCTERTAQRSSTASIERGIRWGNMLTTSPVAPSHSPVVLARVRRVSPQLPVPRRPQRSSLRSLSQRMSMTCRHLPLRRLRTATRVPVKTVPRKLRTLGHPERGR
jgi:hypothetical protein